MKAMPASPSCPLHSVSEDQEGQGEYANVRRGFLLQELNLAAPSFPIPLGLISDGSRCRSKPPVDCMLVEFHIQVRIPKTLFGMALDLWEEYRAGAVSDFEAGGEWRFAVSYQLRERAVRDRDNQHLLKVLRRYHLNRVERALRPALIARKVSQCSKNYEGAYAFSAFKSVIQTLVKRDAGSLVEALYTLFRSPKAPLVPG